MSHEEVVTIPFVDMEGITPTAIAFAEVIFDGDAPSDRDAQLRPIIAAVTDWVRETDEGRAAYRESCYELNIGDLYTLVGPTPTPALARRLHRHGVRLQSLWAAGTPDPVVFDKTLIELGPSEDFDEGMDDDAAG